MSSKYFISFFGFLCVILLVGINITQAASQKTKTIKITENLQTFIPKSNFYKLKRHISSGYIKFEIQSKSQIKLIENDNELIFFLPTRDSAGTGSLTIHAGDKNVSIPFEIDITRNLENFDISTEMLELSLQEKSLSCESSATSNIISSMTGKQVSEEEVISLLPKSLYYNKLPEQHPKTTIWGNPNSGFVGYIDHTDDISAKQKLMTGYGVYEQPISKVYKKLGFSTQTFNKDFYTKNITAKTHLRYLLEKLKRGHMVQLWGDWCTIKEYDDGVLASKKEFNDTDSGRERSAKNSCYNVEKERALQWKYYNEHGELQQHIGLDGEHAFILLGWKGDISNPSHIRVWDTDTGYHLYPTHEWMRKWGKMDYRSIVVNKKEGL